uniref:Uncharacterized protein n=1 Tax=Sphaerodactylus townsendi TaxID=933632 RepID=A0ACB8GBW5_9SAUR
MVPSLPVPLTGSEGWNMRCLICAINALTKLLILGATSGLSYDPLTWSDLGIEILADCPPFMEEDHRLATLPVDYCNPDPGGGPLLDLPVSMKPQLLNPGAANSMQILDCKQTSVRFSTDFLGGAWPKTTTYFLQHEHLRINPTMHRELQLSEMLVQPPSRSDPEESDGTGRRELESQLLDAQIWLEQMEVRVQEAEAKVQEYRR